MVDVIRQILNYLVAHYALYMVVTMSIIVSMTIGILTLVKKPIKRLTAKIENERIRKLANKMFIFMAFGVSATAWFLLNVIAPSYFQYEHMQVLLSGAFSIVVYALGDGIITKSAAQKIVECVTEINKADETDNPKPTPPQEGKDPVKSFWDMVK